MMIQITKYQTALYVLFLTFLCISCTDEKQEQTSFDGYNAVQVTLSPFNNGGTISDKENKIDNLQACLFKEGMLTEVFTNPGTLSDNLYTLQLKETSGTLYVVANTTDFIDLPALKQQGMTESEWLGTKLTTNEGKAINFFAGKVSLGAPINGQSVLPIELERGVARIDLQLSLSSAAAIQRITLKDIPQESFLFTPDETDTPEGVLREDMDIAFAHPLSDDSLGIAYVYEQTGLKSKVIAEIVSNGETHVKETNLPSTLKRNTIYKLAIRQEEGSKDFEIEIAEWENEEGVLQPDFGSHITINQTQSALPSDAQIAESNDALSLPSRSMDFTLALNCDDELEFAYCSHPDIAVQSVGQSASFADRNQFVIHKPLLPPGYPQETAKVYFRRKGLKEVYEEDCITLTLQENPIQVDGMSFDRTNYTCDFGCYIDNELGRFTLPEEMEIVAEFEDEDPWIKIEKLSDGTNVYRILGGWKPNDPKADGRSQKARLVVRRIADQQETEGYTVIRRNYGLPVTYLNGIWWCRYNAIGNSKAFDEQILSANDPARLSGKTVQEYLKTCTQDEYLQLWNAAYEGNTGVALKAVYQDNRFTLNGWRSSESHHINKEDPKALSPNGYEMPTFEDYKQIFSSFIIPNSWSGFNPQNGGADYRSEIILEKRSGIQLDGHDLNELWSFSVRSIKGNGEEPLTFYGVGCQWNNDGINSNWILMACHNPNVTGWLVRGNNASLEHNGAVANNTRIIRFKKSPVEYIYE